MVSLHATSLPGSSVDFTTDSRRRLIDEHPSKHSKEGQKVHSPFLPLVFEFLAYNRIRFDAHHILPVLLRFSKELGGQEFPSELPEGGRYSVNFYLTIAVADGILPKVHRTGWVPDCKGGVG